VKRSKWKPAACTECCAVFLLLFAHDFVSPQRTSNTSDSDSTDSENEEKILLKETLIFGVSVVLSLLLLIVVWFVEKRNQRDQASYEGLTIRDEETLFNDHDKEEDSLQEDEQDTTAEEKQSLAEETDTGKGMEGSIN